jgi:hypothetical protein
MAIESAARAARLEILLKTDTKTVALELGCEGKFVGKATVVGKSDRQDGGSAGIAARRHG